MMNTSLAANLCAAAPEAVLAVLISAMLVFDGVTKVKHTLQIHKLSILTCVAIGAYCLYFAGIALPEVAFNDMYVNDALSFGLKGFTALAVAVTLVYSRQYVIDRDMFKGEFHALALFALLGQMIMISANTLLLIYLGLELLSLSLYAAVALRRDHAVATEAAMKYFVLGALASGFLLYGMSMIYGATGSLELPDIAKASVAVGTDKTILVFGLVFLVSGLAFKLGVVPFHMWVPDVYQGSPSAITLLISGAPKLAAFSMLIRLLVDSLFAMAIDWQQMLTLLAVLSIVLGNLTAIAQTNLKRMLAFSAIAQMGFMLLGMLSGVIGANTSGAAAAYSASMFYVLVYVLTTLGTFGVILAIAHRGLEAEEISDLKGLNKRSPWMALVMLILMFSLAGIPPLAGFYSKLAVLQALLASGQIWLTVVAVVFSLIGAFYYLRVVKVMYFEEPTISFEPTVTADARVMLGVNGAAIVLLGILPSPLLSLCGSAIQKMLGS
jgi:NADH-quinone oxidoreductase subunit N